MTDREKLIELLEEMEDLPFDTVWSEADFLIENGVTFATDTNVGKWIPVTERLPEEYETVLCFDGTGVEPGEFLKGRFVEFDKYESDDLCGVTHWMPLPEPPKGE